MMVVEDDLKLPDKKEDESLSAFYVGEERELTPEKKRVLKKQKKFEYERVQKKKVYEKEEKKEELKTKITRWVILGVTFLYLLWLYFWLIA